NRTRSTWWARQGSNPRPPRRKPGAPAASPQLHRRAEKILELQCLANEAQALNGTCLGRQERPILLDDDPPLIVQFAERLGNGGPVTAAATDFGPKISFRCPVLEFHVRDPVWIPAEELLGRMTNEILRRVSTIQHRADRLRIRVGKETVGLLHRFGDPTGGVGEDGADAGARSDVAVLLAGGNDDI